VVKKFLPFEEAREYVRKLGLKGIKEWYEFTKSDEFPDFLPKRPEGTYKDEWQGATDWVGGKQAKYLTGEELLPFEEAKEYVRKLGLKDVKEWYEYCKSGKKPLKIPNAPFSAYKIKWSGFSDWLGTDTRRAKKILPFEEARKIARSLKFTSTKQWNEFKKSKEFPDNIPRAPETKYEEFSGYKDWLGYNYESKFMSFDDAKKELQKLGITSSTQFLKFRKENKVPKNIPTNPHLTYKDKWQGWAGFLGTKNISFIEKSKTYLTFDEAREKICHLGIKNFQDWRKFCKDGKNPDNIPNQPDLKYVSEWGGWSYWLGKTNEKVNSKIKYLPFEEAREYVRKLGLKDVKEWNEFKKSKEFPENIPKNPKKYPEFTNITNWISTSEKYSSPKSKMMSFEDAKKFVRSMGFKGQKEWYQYCKSGKKPTNIPFSPYTAYKDKWINLADWLGTKRTRSTKFLPFEKAREYARSLKLTGMMEWNEICREGKMPLNIPNNPHATFSHEWVDWYDWLGNENTDWTVSNVKELLRELIKSKIIYQWDEAVLYSFLLRRGVLGTAGKHHEFFKNLIRASKDSGGMKAIEQYAKSNNDEPPDLSAFGGKTSEPDEEIKTSENEGEILEEDSEKDPLEKKYLESVHDILSHTEVLESISVDEEAMQFYVNYTINQLWKRAFDNPEETIRDVRNSVNNKNKYHNLVIKTFLDDYQKTIELKIPKGYAFRDPTTNELIKPFLMQRYVAYKVKSQPSFGNFSGTGAGKTLSAIIGSRVIDSKFTLIVCPNDVVKHWVNNIREVFPDSKIISGKDVFDAKYDGDVHQYCVLNYDKLNQEDSVNQILKLSKEKVNFVILDEIHFSKVTSDKNISLRRENLEGLLSQARKINPEIKVLGLSATPVVNNINEGKSLLELMTGKVYDDLVTRPTIPNAVALYEKLSTLSIRQIPNYPEFQKEFVDVDANQPDKEQIQYLNNNPLAIEQILTDARLAQIIKRINGQTIIYTEYVTKIIEKITKAVEDADFKFGYYVGGNDTGLEPFKKKEIQVLIASRPISTGVDGLQRVCSNLIFNTLPWTNAQYIQLIGRIVRTGQDKEVTIHHVLAGIGGYLYDHLKMNRIKFKKTLADCAVDGVLPERNLITPQKATKEAIAWLARLESGKITSVSRRELDVKLTPVEIETRVRTFGDFAKLNQKINIENSSTTHKRLLANPEEWEEYHRQYREARKEWSIIPYEVWINRINELSDRLVIADFGCGEAKIQQAVGSRVHSFDHVAIDQSVTSGDMKNVPLTDSSIDIAIFSLSLMGKNWKEYISEAKRCLATNMYLFITVTTDSLENRLSELRDVLSEEGFDVYQDEVKGDFTFIEARKL